MPKKVNKDLIIKLYRDGFTQRDISYLIGCSLQTVNKVLSENKVTLEDFKEVSERDIEKILYYYRQGHSPSYIAKVLKIRASKVVSVLEDYLDE